MLGKILIMSTILISSLEVTIQNNKKEEVHVMNKTYESGLKVLFDHCQKEINGFKTEKDANCKNVKELIKLLRDKSVDQNAEFEFKYIKFKGGESDVIKFSSNDLHHLFSFIDLQEAFEVKLSTFEDFLSALDSNFNELYKKALTCVVNKDSDENIIEYCDKKILKKMILLSESIAKFQIFMSCVYESLEKLRNGAISADNAKPIWIELCKNVLCYYRFKTHRLESKKELTFVFYEPPNFPNQPLWGKVKRVLEDSQKKYLILQ